MLARPRLLLLATALVGCNGLGANATGSPDFSKEPLPAYTGEPLTVFVAKVSGYEHRGSPCNNQAYADEVEDDDTLVVCMAGVYEVFYRDAKPLLGKVPESGAFYLVAHNVYDLPSTAFIAAKHSDGRLWSWHQVSVVEGQACFSLMEDDPARLQLTRQGQTFVDDETCIEVPQELR